MSDKATFAEMMTGGDPAQKARRAAAMTLVDRPERHLNEAWQALRNGMRGVGNQPDRELLSCVKSLQKALELGFPVDDLDLLDMYRGRWAGEPDELMAVWRLVVGALEAEAIRRAQPVVDAHAQIEAQTSMEPVSG